jgi:SPP1 family predicted phage head-tail adaptor
VKAGTLDRRIRFERRIVTQDPVYGTSKATWEPVITVWAQVRDILPSRAESVDESISLARHPAQVRIRYRTGITSDMRVIYGERTMQIVAGPAELGRREALELMVEEMSTQGEAP